MKKIDRYIIRKFLGTFFYAITLIILIAVVFDVSEKVDDFLEKSAPLRAIVFDYYFNFIPFFINLFSPLFTFISVVFFTARMAAGTEIIAILGSGVSFGRLLVPYLGSAAVIALLSFTLNNWVIPPANARRLAFEEAYIRDPFTYSGGNIHRQISPGTFIYFESFNNLAGMGSRFSMEKVENGVMTYKLMADYARWDTTGRRWGIENYFIRKVDGDREHLERGSRLDTVMDFHPGDFVRRRNNVETMNYGELNNFISTERMRGASNIEFYLVEKYRRAVFPFATFILTVIAVAMACRKVRGGVGAHIGFGMLIAFSYILFMQVFTTFAIQGGLAPLVAVWIPNLLFGILALYLVRLAPK